MKTTVRAPDRMARSIYRSDAGHHAIRTWCALRLDGAGATSRDLDSSLGATRVTIVGGGRDVVLLPGTNFSTATSLELLALVGREHRAIGIDLPGQPGLSAAERPRDRDAYGIWLRELVRALAVERPVVVGHSLSGRAALLAARGDASIGGLVLVAPAGLIRLRVGPAVLATTIHWLLRRDEAILGDAAAPDDRPRRGPSGRACDVDGARGPSRAHQPGATAPAHSCACRGAVPRPARHGPPRPVFPARRLTEALTKLGGPTATTVVDTAGHLLMEEAPHEVLRAVQVAARA
jgi:pimeloyl-ACP methyl ester carboxylesterase